MDHSITGFVHYYNDERYHESLQNRRPADVYFGRSETIQARREVVKQNTLRLRKKENLTSAIEPWNPVGSVLPY